MSNTPNTTPLGVSNSPIHTPATSLAAFIAITNDILVMIETDEDAGQWGEIALTKLASNAACAEARCKTSVSHFLARPQTDPVLHAAARQIDGLIHDLGDAPGMLARYPHAVMRLADLCALRAALNTQRGIIDMHSTRCAEALRRAACLLGRMVESAAACEAVTLTDDPSLSIQDMLSV